MGQRKISLLLGFVAVLLLFTSCKEEEKDHVTYWGKTDYYSDFLFKKYKPVLMTNTINLDFNDDGKVVSEVKFGLFKKDKEGKYLPATDDVRLYKNGNLCHENTFVVSGNEDEVDLSVEFTPEANAGTHRWYVKVLDTGGLDRVNDSDFGEPNDDIILEWIAKKNDVWNPLAFTLSVILLILLAALLIWVLILRKMFFPTFQIGTISITEPYFSVRKLKGCYKIVYTSKKQSQSVFSKLFTGTIIYDINPIWTTDWVVNPRDKKSVRPISSPNYTLNPFATALQKGEEYTLTNMATSEKIKIFIN